MQWNEVQGICIGYSGKGTSGSGIGPELRKRIINTAREIILKGKEDLELFELIGLFEEDFGPDRLSDMTANIIKDDLILFSLNTFKQILNVLPSSFIIDDKTGLPINNFNKKLILLLPKSILRDLPMAFDWSSIDFICRHNNELRQIVNKMIGENWKSATANNKKIDIKNLVLEHPEVFDDLVTIYRNKKPEFYDFKQDRSGEYSWHPVSQKIVKDEPLSLMLPISPSIDDVEKLVLEICMKFKTLIENNGLWQHLYNDDGSIKHESAAQLLFYGIADSYCDANKIMIARESNAGRGPVDFKFGNHKENSILVEVKKSTNTSGLKKGIVSQLPIYMASEEAKRGIYLVLDVGFTKAAIENLKAINKITQDVHIKIIQIDGTYKKSASK
jgi:hypothetical protein